MQNRKASKPEDLARSGRVYELQAAFKGVADPRAERPTLLHEAAAGVNKPVIRWLLGQGWEATERTPDHEEPLHWIAAGRSQSIAVASLLLEHGATVNGQDANGNTALHAAATASDLKLVWLLMGAGWDPATKNRQGDTCLHLAGDARTTAYFAARASDIDVRDDKGQTALLRAAAHGNQEKARVLLEHSASAKHANLNGDTALHAARTSEVAQVLLNAGADIEACASDGATPLIRFCQRSHPSPLIHTVLQAGASAATTDHRGQAALHYLIRQCASTPFGRGDRYGEIMALSAANERSAASFAQTLIRHVREDPIARLESLPRETRETFLIGDGGITLLLAHGASLEEEAGKPSLLSVAAERESSWAMLHLLEAGANPNHVDQNGETPLHVTRRKEARHPTRFMVFDHPVSPSEILEAYGADPSRKNSQGRTPDDYKRISIKRGLPDWIYTRPLWGRDERNTELPWERLECRKARGTGSP